MKRIAVLTSGGDAPGMNAAIRAIVRTAVAAGFEAFGVRDGFEGAHALHNHGLPVVGIASTIDNDVHGADIAIGVDTAFNVALEAIDRLRATASSHRRAMLVEVTRSRRAFARCTSAGSITPSS